jgi:hypothetical protein
MQWARISRALRSLVSWCSAFRKNKRVAEVREIRDGQYLVVHRYGSAGLLDNHDFTIVHKVLNPKDGSFYLYCRMCKSEDCDCTEAARAFRRSIYLDTDTKDEASG